MIKNKTRDQDPNKTPTGITGFDEIARGGLARAQRVIGNLEDTPPVSRNPGLKVH
jgi:hypothetical protein